MKPLYWRLGGLAIALLLLVATWFIMVNPQRTQAGELETARQDQLAQSAALQAKISLLKKQAEELPRKEAELAAIQRKLPASAAIPSLIRTLNRNAKRAKVTMSTLTPGQPTAIKAAIPAGSRAVGSPPAESGSDSAAQPNADATPSAAPKPTAASALVQAIPVSLTACGSYSQLRYFLVQMESMERAMLITGLNIGKGDCGEGGDDRTLTATITASVFTMPAPQPVAAPQPTPSASPSGGPR